jgi:hypothetical protein
MNARQFWQQEAAFIKDTSAILSVDDVNVLPSNRTDSKNSSQYLNKAIKLFSDAEFKTARADSKASAKAQTEYAYLIYYEKIGEPLKISAKATGSTGGVVAGNDWNTSKNSLPKDATIIGIYHSHPLETNSGVDNPFSDGDVENVFNAIRYSNVLGSDIQDGFFWIADAQDRRYACLIEDFVIAKKKLTETEKSYSTFFYAGPANANASGSVTDKIRLAYSKTFVTKTGIGIYSGSHNGTLKRM